MLLVKPPGTFGIMIVLIPMKEESKKLEKKIKDKEKELIYLERSLIALRSGKVVIRSGQSLLIAEINSRSINSMPLFDTATSLRSI